MSQPATTPPAAAGRPVVLGGNTYTMQPLTFGAWKRCAHALQLLAEGSVADVATIMDAVTDVVLAALQRAHPELQRATVEDAMDWALGQELCALVLQISVPQGALGETPVASPAGASTGTS